MAGCRDDEEVTVLRLGHNLDTQHSIHVALEQMAAHLEEVSGGRMRLEIYPSSVLGSQRENLELLQLGSLDMTKASAASLEGFVKEYKVFGLPYLFKDQEHAHAIYDGPVGEEILAKGEKVWLKGLCFYDAGARSFYSSKPIRGPGDLAGLKVRVMPSITSFEMIRAMGGSPTPISWGELYTALQGGVVDAAENNPTSFYLSNHYEVCPFYVLDEHTRIPDVLIISTHSLAKLSEQEKKWLMEAVQESVEVQREEWNRSEERALGQLAENGVQIVVPDKQPFIDASGSVYTRYENDADLSRLIAEIKSVSSKHDTAMAAAQ